MSSFVKIKKDDLLEITGLKISVRNGQVCSTGSDSLDFVIGGGIELNSLFLLGKITYYSYRSHKKINIQVKTSMENIQMFLRNSFLLMHFTITIEYILLI